MGRAVLARSLLHSLPAPPIEVTMGRLLSTLASAATLLVGSVAFAQKAPPGDLGVSAPEPALLLLAGAVAAPLVVRAWRRSNEL